MVKQHKPVLRTCVCSRETLEQKDLFRIVRTPEGTVVVAQGRVNGRGAYLKKDKEVILKAKKIKCLDRQLEVSVPDSIYDELLGLL